MPHNVLLKLLYFPSTTSHSPLHTHWTHTAIILKAYISGCVSIRVVNITNASSFVKKVSTEEILVILFACEICHRLISQNLIQLLVHHMGQSLIYK